MGSVELQWRLLGAIDYRARLPLVRVEPGLKMTERPKLRTCPDIVVEVMSEGAIARQRDLVDKRDLYLRRGALEYWVVDLDERSLLRLVRAGDAWHEARLTRLDRLSTPLLQRWDGVVLGDLFRGGF
jgi:Uma2 family endonuclease